MIRAVILAAIVLAACAYLLDDTEAMAKCQERHSFDTCFYSLHR